jgi:hypothetical protein
MSSEREIKFSHKLDQEKDGSCFLCTMDAHRAGQKRRLTCLF